MIVFRLYGWRTVDFSITNFNQTCKFNVWRVWSAQCRNGRAQNDVSHRASNNEQPKTDSSVSWSSTRLLQPDRQLSSYGPMDTGKLCWRSRECLSWCEFIKFENFKPALETSIISCQYKNDCIAQFTTCDQNGVILLKYETKCICMIYNKCLLGTNTNSC